MSAITLMELDDLSRKKIVTETNSNFFVEAGAGSGKTTILVKRMVAMVEQGMDVSKICAITFTKAAALEFYDRFQKELIKRSTAPTVEHFEPKPGDLGNPTDVTRVIIDSRDDGTAQNHFCAKTVQKLQIRKNDFIGNTAELFMQQIVCNLVVI